MTTGRLWFCDTSKTLSQNIRDAATYFNKRHGRMPDLCLVHPSMLNKQGDVDKILVRPYRPVLPGHLWIGCEEMQTRAAEESPL